MIETLRHHVTGTGRGRHSVRAAGGPTARERRARNDAPYLEAAFTLTELLVVIAVLALLAATQLPALTRARVPAKQIQCMSNLRQLTVAWKLYATDNQDQLINNFGLANTLQYLSEGFYENWANNYMDWSTDPVNTNRMLLERGIMMPFLLGDISVFKCPADNYLSPSQRFAGVPARTRSVAMNAFLGLYGRKTQAAKYTSGRNNNYDTYRQWLKMSEFARPANTMVFLDEHPDPLNDGLFTNNPMLDSQGRATGTKWSDAPASFHDGAANLTFADGHTETYFWKSTKTRFPVTYVSGSAGVPNFDADPKATDDLTWMVTRQAVLYPKY